MAVNVVIYCRVSTEDQTNDPQRAELRAEAARRAWTVAAEIEDTISGAKRSREGLDELMRLVRSRSIQGVLVYKLDRLGRSLPHLVQLIGEFDAHGVALVCTSQGLDTSDHNPAGRLVAHILAAISQFERSLISDRTKVGMRTAKANGAQIGRKPATMPENAAEILNEWVAAGGKNYRRLAIRLGVNVGTAYRYATASGTVLPSLPSLSVSRNTATLSSR